jgi:diguanylate cyclase (GGDEF)-like protein/PAS domain S-box-containing protein
MNLLDIRTVLFSYTLSNLVCMIVMAFLWIQNHRRFAGLGFWMASFIIQFTALVLLDLRNIAPGFLSMTVSNTLVIGGTVLIYAGLERFTGKRGPQVHNYILLAVFFLLHTLFVFVFPSLTVRNILFSLGLLAICSQCAWLTLRRVNPEMRRITRGVGYVFVAFCVVSIARMAADLSTPLVSDFFHSNIYDILSIITYQMLFIILTFSLSLMVNRRLLMDLESDIIAREQAEAALRLSEEKYFKAFQSSPDAITISRLRDGRLIEVNEGFCQMAGYSRQEALSSSSVDLGLWADPHNRDEIVAELLKNRRVRNYEYNYHVKSGAILQCLYSGEIIYLGGEENILSVVRDITELKRAEKILRLRLSLWEFLSTHSVDELMQKALDEIEVLTDSSIGFYHFVEEDQNTLSLQAWSTRTLAEFCQAEGNGLHYPISDAGVWVDCVHQRKPVIHNDYASLPHRKGMPVGHAKVIREVVVPTLRDDRVVAILGVGNKPTDYDDQDVELVAYIADLVWSIVEQKRADEQIRQLNTQLERLAMTDELTGLTNRRSFFIQGEKEVKRAQRYQTPLSMLMLDLDGFKAINDTYGHDAGDLMLQCIANTIRENIREIDVVARLGGEEFSVMLPNTQAVDATKLAERLRLAVEGLHCPFQDQNMSVTMSIGVATFGNEISNLDTLLRNADTAMYQAKNQGRNRVVFLE